MVMIRKYRSSISRRHGLIAATDQGNTTQGGVAYKQERVDCDSN